ncbi:MAG: hypothetical protein AB1724_11775 [Thermodesulfobacteriota bacterium]
MDQNNRNSPNNLGNQKPSKGQKRKTPPSKDTKKTAEDISQEQKLIDDILEKLCSVEDNMTDEEVAAYHPENRLFVCFSDDALIPTVGEPAFHTQIKDFAANLTKDTFSEFYEKRFEWHWYPIISGFSSGPVHGDLPGELTDERLLEAIGYTASICAREDQKRFISALGLLSLLCRNCEKPEEVPSLTKHFMQIRESVTRNAIDPNIPYWFSKVVLFQLSTGVVPDGYSGSFDRDGLDAPDKGWQGYGDSLDFPVVDQSGWGSCPGGEDAVKEEIKPISGGEFVLEFQRNALHEGYKFWIWLYRNVSENPIWHFYVYVVTTPDGKTEVHRESMHSVESVSPEELVAQHVFQHGK